MTKDRGLRISRLTTASHQRHRCRSPDLPTALPVPTVPTQVSQQPLKKSHSKKKGPGHIPRPRNAFILFRSATHEQNIIPEELIANYSDFSKIVAKVWNKLTEGQKQPWYDMAQKEKESHQKRYPGWSYKPQQLAHQTHGRPEKVMDKICGDVEAVPDFTLSPVDEKSSQSQGVITYLDLSFSSSTSEKSALLTPLHEIDPFKTFAPQEECPIFGESRNGHYDPLSEIIRSTVAGSIEATALKEGCSDDAFFYTDSPYTQTDLGTDASWDD